MDELTLGLIGAGAVVVGGVVVYNAWQGAKVRRKMPRPMPDEAAESLARNDSDEEQPFIEPTRPVRREPALGEGDVPDTRVEPSFGGAGDTMATLDGDWSVALNGKDSATELKPWEALGTTGFAGPATYKRQFTVAATPRGKHVYLEIGDVHDYARVTLNGKDVGERAWQPYRWDVTSALRKGTNDLEIVVNATPAGRGPGGGPPPAAAPAAPAVGLATAPPAGAGGAAGGAGGQRRRQGAGAPGAAGAGASPQAPTAAVRPAAPPATSGLLGPVTLVAR